MRSRTRARETALKFLYEYDLNGGRDVPTPPAYLDRTGVAPDAREYALRLMEGVTSTVRELDERISSCAVNWRLERMAAVDRNLLRIGAWEILKSGDIPGQVAINEAVDLAKRYGSARSGSFVNGILDRILALREGAEPTPEELPHV